METHQTHTLVIQTGKPYCNSYFRVQPLQNNASLLSLHKDLDYHNTICLLDAVHAEFSTGVRQLFLDLFSLEVNFESYTILTINKHLARQWKDIGLDKILFIPDVRI